MSYDKIKILKLLFAFSGVFLIWCFFFTPNFLITVPVVLYIPFIFYLFFEKGNTNVLFWGLLFQWTNVSIQLLYCNLLGISLETYFKKTVFPAELMDYTVLLSVCGLFVFSFGIYRAIRFLNFSIPEKQWKRYDATKWLQAYCIVSILIYLFQAAIWSFPNVVQYFYFLFYIKWGFFLVAFICVYKNDTRLKIFVLAIIIVEFTLGLSTFFASSFLNIIMFSLIAYVAVTNRINWFKGLMFLFLGLILLHVSVLWTASKKDFRSFVSEGQITQSVTVSDDEARKKLFELVTNIDQATYNRGLEELVNRVGYIQFFAACIRHVPAKIPHENGSVYWAAISHFFIPRFIDPDKPVLDDTKHTNKYTGLKFSGSKSATSFSLGSFADAYVDFGSLFMFIPLFLFGYIIGWFYKSLYVKAINHVWSIVLTGPFFLLINVYGADTTKAFGFLLIYFLTIAILSYFFMRFIDPLLIAKVKEQIS